MTGRHVNRYTTGPKYVVLFGSLTKLTTFISKVNVLDWRRPTLAGGNPQLPSALKSLTSVFGMGTGVTSSPSSPDYFELVHSKLNKTDIVFRKSGPTCPF